MTKTQLAFFVSCTQAVLDFTVTLDGEIQWQGRPGPDGQRILIEFDDVDGMQHELEFALSGKTFEHTEIDEQGSILSDVVLDITDVSFDDIVIDQMVHDLAKYHHDFNGSKEPIVDHFFGTMGCNGTVKLQFTTPIYLWLLENM